MTTHGARSITQIDADLAPLLKQSRALAAKIRPLREERDLAEKRRVDAGELSGPELVLLAQGGGQAASRANQHIDGVVKAAHPMLYSWGVYSDRTQDKTMVSWFTPTALFKKNATDEEIDTFIEAVTALFAEFQPTAHDLGDGPEPHQIDMMTDVDEDMNISPRIYVNLATGEAELTMRGRHSSGFTEATGTLAEVIRIACTRYSYGWGR